MTQISYSPYRLFQLAFFPVLIGLLHLPSTTHAQVVATWIGPATGNWSNPANWDIGIVPINNGPNTYNVIIPAGKTVEFDIGANSTISGLNLQDTGKINIAGGMSLNVSGFTLVAGIITSNGVGSNFTATSPFTVFQPNPELHASNGAVVQVAGLSYVSNRDYRRTFLSALGAGSRLDLQSITNFDYNNPNTSNHSIHTVEAGQGGVVNLSGVQTINGADHNESLRFWIHSGGTIDLSNLTNITTNNINGNYFTASYGKNTIFDFQTPVLTLSNLADAVGVNFIVMSGNAANLPQLTGLRDSHLDLSSGANFLAPNLSDIRGSYIRVESGANFSVSTLTQITNSELHARNGGSITVASANYTNTRDYRRSFLSALGAGSRLNLQSITNFDYNNPNTSNHSIHTVEAGQGGVVDLSAVQAINGADHNESLRFWVHTGGSIDLSNLTNITTNNTNASYFTASYGKNTQFDIDVGSYSLPQLVVANGVDFDIAGFSAAILPTLTTLTNSRVDLPALATFTAPVLTDITGTYLRVSGATAMNTPAYSQINFSELHSHNGGGISVSATGYLTNRDYRRSFMSALGTGSRLNLQSITNFDYNNPGRSNNTTHTIEAGQGGVVDLSGVQTINGADHNESLRFFSSGSGIINIGSVGSSTNVAGGNTRFETTGTSAIIHFGSSMNMAENTAMKATLNGRFEAEGNLSIQTKNAANFDLADGRLHMIGVAPLSSQGYPTRHQFLEVGGTFVGVPSGPLGANFQAGVMQIGTNLIKSSVVLQNSYNNNSDPDDTEILYLQGFPSETGLRLLNGSYLFLNGSNVLFSNAQGGWTSARSLIPFGAVSAPFDGGTIALTAPVGNFLKPDEAAAYLTAFNIKGPGSVAAVNTSFGSAGNRDVWKLTAGSKVEIWQNVSTLADEFYISFEALAIDTTGTLTLLLDNQILTTWSIGELSGNDPHLLSYLVTETLLRGAIDIPLTVRWNGDTGHSVLLDVYNFSMYSAVPEPNSAMALLVLALVASGMRRRRR